MTTAYKTVLDLIEAAEAVLLDLGNHEPDPGRQEAVCPICTRTDGMHILPEEHVASENCGRLAAAVLKARQQ